MLLTIVVGSLLCVVVCAIVLDFIGSRPRQVLLATAALTPPEHVFDWARASFAGALRRFGYRLAYVDDVQLVFERGWRPLPVWIVTVLLFPIGIIAFVMGRRCSVLIVAIKADGRGGTELRISGEAQSSLASKLADIADVADPP